MEDDSMLELSGILATPGVGSLFLGLVLLFYLIISKIVNAKKENNDSLELSSSSMSAGANKTAGVVAAITAAVIEYRKHNS